MKNREIIIRTTRVNQISNRVSNKGRKTYRFELCARYDMHFWKRRDKSVINSKQTASGTRLGTIGSHCIARPVVEPRWKILQTRANR